MEESWYELENSTLWPFVVLRQDDESDIDTRRKYIEFINNQPQRIQYAEVKLPGHFITEI
jgi:hypothetical protein